MKKLLIFIAALMTLCCGASAEDGATILIDGKELATDAQPPIIEDGITMVPFRSISEGMGAYVEWVPETQSIVAAKGLTVIKMQIGSIEVTVGGAQKLINAAPSLVNDTTMIPLRAISELLDAEVEWDADTKTVSVTTPKTEAEHNVKTVYHTDGLSTSDGSDLLKIAVAYPVFESDSEGIDKINSLYRTQAREFAAEAKRQFADGLEADYEAALTEGRTFEPMVLLYGYEIAYDKFGYLSLVEQAEVAGGEVFYFDAVTFDSENADILKKEDFLTLSADQEEALDPYDFYLYDDRVILYLDSNNMYLYHYYDYPPSLAIQDSYVNVDLSSGEEKETQSVAAASSEEEERISYTRLYELNSALGFDMAELKDQVRYTANAYSLEDGTGEIEYSENGTNVGIRLKKCPGNADVNQIADAEKTGEEVYNGSVIEYYTTDSLIFSCFSIDGSVGTYSYSVIIDDVSQGQKLESLTKEVADSEISKIG